MKIYIDNYNPKYFSHKQFEPFLIKEVEIGDIFSEEGIYQITKSQLFRLDIEDKEIETIQLPNYRVLVDKSIIRKKNINHIPINHTFSKIYEFYYKYKTNPCIFIVRCMESKQFCFISQPSKMEAIDCYFEMGESTISPELLKENINEFLSLLN
jgi:hypothetical protein